MGRGTFKVQEGDIVYYKVNGYFYIVEGFDGTKSYCFLKCLCVTEGRMSLVCGKGCHLPEKHFRPTTDTERLLYG